MSNLGTKVYVYTPDRKILIHFFYSFRQAGRILNVGDNTLSEANKSNRNVFVLWFDTKIIESSKIAFYL